MWCEGRDLGSQGGENCLEDDEVVERCRAVSHCGMRMEMRDEGMMMTMRTISLAKKRKKQTTSGTRVATIRLSVRVETVETPSERVCGCVCFER
jgi:hypothetical protein